MLADSGWPPPVGRWQSAQARKAGRRPVATAAGIGACSSGNQSGGLKPSPIWAAVYCFLLPGTVSIFSLSGPLPFPFGATGYAQSMPSTADAITDGAGQRHCGGGNHPHQVPPKFSEFVLIREYSSASPLTSKSKAESHRCV